MRTYGQYCSVAKALDVVGDRWTLLIVRELLAQGPCRYTDLRKGLPGIATNLLSDRLRELERAGLIRKEAAPPPVATSLFHLTETGADLEPIVVALGRWGTRLMAEPNDGDEFRGHWFAFPVSLFLRDQNPSDPPVSIELRTADGAAVVEVSNGSIRTRVGAARDPDLALRGTPPVILGVLSGRLDLTDARNHGLEITGDYAVLERLQPNRASEPATTP